MSGAIHTSTSTWQEWVHVCGYVLESSLYYNGVQEYPIWRILNGKSVAYCPQCLLLLRGDHEKRQPLA